MYRFLTGAVVCLLLTGGSASAQNVPTFGLVIGVPTQVGLLWQVTERVAVRPDVSWTWYRADTTATGLLAGYDASTRTTGVVLGVSGLFYLGGHDDLRTYVVPRYGLSRSSSAIDSDLSISGLPDQLQPATSIRSTRRSHAGSVAFGAHYTLGSRFGLFAELGLEFASSSNGGGTGGLDSTARSVGTRSGVGVVLFF
jgi:hypothetical protein